MTGNNRAAVSNGNKSVPFYEIKNLSIPSVPKGKVLVKAIAYAFNPTDWKHPVYGMTPEGAVLGSDFSGIVEAVGSEVEGLAKGDYVSGWAHGGYEKDIGGFQDWVLADPPLVIKFDKSQLDQSKVEPVGDSESRVIDNFEGAASVTLGLSTIAMSFTNQLKLKVNEPSYRDQYILIWGGATASGVLAIQVAKDIYGLKVITTASPRNNAFLKSLGADHIVNYNDKDVIEKIRKIGGGKIHFALDTISSLETFQLVYDATAGTNEGTVAIDNLLLLNPEEIKTDKSRTNLKFGKTLAYVANGEPTVFAGIPVAPDADLAADYGNFWYNILPGYLPKLRHSNLKVLNPGLESVHEGLSLLMDNKVSGEKVVFRADN
ncbi:uncharacterized protein CLIB1423_11S03268 [[Candida] railenensis]|uniref:Enoyl reductase (ER) domain-containing protein n=1 Tax=[Candida] railenensis TaxID=45579 RepID=A0A9P0QS21_9ASCO|nr:uncharacterized protein CLIB1423_11S03268 [[Candida] railenensis]